MTFGLIVNHYLSTFDFFDLIGINVPVRHPEEAALGLQKQ